MSDERATESAAGNHRWRLWAQVDRRPGLWTVGRRDPPHAEDCGCFSCGGWTSRATHPDACLCWQCQPERWKGARHRRLLGFLAQERAIYDAQRSKFGIYDLLPYLSRVGLDWLNPPSTDGPPTEGPSTSTPIGGSAS